MAFKAVYEKLEDVPEALKDQFKQGEDGKFRPDIEAVDGWALEDVTGLKGTLEKEMKNRKEAEGKLKAFGDLNADEARKAIDRVKEIGDLDPEKEAEQIAAKKLELQREELVREHDKEKGELSGKLQARTTQLEGALVDAVATAAITDPEVKGNPILLLPHVKAQTQVVENDSGELVVEIVDPTTKTPRLGDSQGTPMTFEQLVAEMREKSEYAAAFEGSGQSGGGMPPDNRGGGNGSVKPDDVSKMSMAEYKEAREKGAIT